MGASLTQISEGLLRSDTGRTIKKSVAHDAPRSSLWRLLFLDTGAQIEHIGGEQVNLGVTEKLFPCRHLVIAALGNRFNNCGLCAAVKPNLVGQIGRAERLHSFGVSAVTTGTASRIESFLAPRHPRRTRTLRWTCKLCDATTHSPVNPRAWAGGAVFATCGGCATIHKLRDNLGLFHELAGPVFPGRGA